VSSVAADSVVSRPAEVEGHTYNKRGIKISKNFTVRNCFYDCPNCANLETFIIINGVNIAGLYKESSQPWASGQALPLDFQTWYKYSR